MLFIFFFFFQAEDGIRDLIVTGVQTCALPIYRRGLDPDHDFIGTGFGRLHADERYFEFAAVLDQRTKLKSGVVVFQSHGESPFISIFEWKSIAIKASVRRDLRVQPPMSMACPRRRTWRVCRANRNRAAAQGRSWDRRRASVPRPSASSDCT